MMRITDGRLDKADAPAVKSRAFHLTTEEARAAPDVIVGTFLVNGMTAHIFFDSGATRSFVSLALGKKFRDAPKTLDSPLEVKIADDRIMGAVRVYRNCVMNVLGERFWVDLFPIPLRGIKAIVGMDWLGANGSMIDCERQLVRVRTPSGGDWLFMERGPRRGQFSVLQRGLGDFYSRVVWDFWHISRIWGPRPP
ncbi:uncharacterized protein LOC111917162 [Lactuca sativa]|uniref:uncharacterized protein LOC111917162 n=1 Tax=Lactuca sativa TaxID=4236 RepID=UPI000CD9D728|nr:uncharacterized protein LOC111917162 [Lactuca sativa]